MHWATLLVVICISSPLFAQDWAVDASVDRATVRQNESFTYTLRVEGSFRGEPNDAALRASFDVLNVGTSTRIQIVGGQTEQVAIWQYQLMAPAPGTVTIPSIDVGGVASNSVTINILPETAPGDEAAEIFMEVEVQPNSAYVQAQIIFTVRLFVGVAIGRATMTAPDVEGVETIVERLGEDTRYRTIRSGREFDVRERRYAVFAQDPGEITIGPVVFEAMVVPSRGFSRIQRFRSDAVSVTVLPAVAPPLEYPDAVWLPASRVEIAEGWSEPPDTLEMGVPRTRALTITADGLLETQLPEITLDEANGIRQYADQPELERRTSATGLSVSRTERYAVIAQSAGTVDIPAIELPWWNVATETWEVARVDSRTVTVNSSEPAEPEPFVITSTEALDSPERVVRSPGIWPYVAGLAGLGWLVTLVAWFRQAYRSRAPAVAKPSSRRINVRGRLRMAIAACAASDAASAQQALLGWAEDRFTPSPPRTLGALAREFPADTAAALEELESHLYGGRSGLWNGETLAQLLGEFERAGKGSRSQKKDLLPPLYQ